MVLIVALVSLFIAFIVAIYTYTLGKNSSLILKLSMFAILFATTYTGVGSLFSLALN